MQSEGGRMMGAREQAIEQTKTTLTILLAIAWLQAGLWELHQNARFVASHCEGDNDITDKFIMTYCAIHRPLADWTSLNAIITSFCFAGWKSLVLTSTIIATMVSSARRFCIPGIP